MENKEIKNINTQEEENPVEKYVKEIQKKQEQQELLANMPGINPGIM